MGGSVCVMGLRSGKYAGVYVRVLVGLFVSVCVSLGWFSVLERDRCVKRGYECVKKQC